MDHIGLASASMNALIVYSWLASVFATLGSLCLYWLLASRSNPAAGILATIAWAVAVALIRWLCLAMQFWV